MPERIVAIDPGGTNGCCLFVGNTLSAHREITSLNALYQWIVRRKPTVIVVEDFHGGFARNAAAPREAIGVVKLTAEKLKVPLVIQQPNAQLTFRKKAEIIVSGRHERSAVAHALYYLSKVR